MSNLIPFPLVAGDRNPGPLLHEIPPRLGWEDLFFAPEVRDALLGLIERWRHCPHILGQWGLGRRHKSRGLVALFSGEPGTGKTEAASLVAATLGLKLLQVSTAALLSKYIGETEKNLEQILSVAAQRSEEAALIFDEGETLFARRMETRGSGELAHNSQVGLLLGRLERFDGLVMLTTNQPGRIDPAFLRRFHVHVEFPLPGPEERRKILRLCLAEAPLAADIDWSLLDQHELSGGAIQNIATNAAYQAYARGLGHVDRAALKRALADELHKLGRLVAGRE
jgi:SpoVK/Ycf46/Vps4 family AAA+-type ATPase